MKGMNRAVMLASMFAGLSNISENVKNALIKVPSAFRGDTSSNHSRGGNTKRVNKNRTADHKWDFKQRASAGLGLFKNRTTGEERVFKIANPESTPRNPVRELSVIAQKHFGSESANLGRSYRFSFRTSFSSIGANSSTCWANR